jgi:hypothetical protein
LEGCAERPFVAPEPLGRLAEPSFVSPGPLGRLCRSAFFCSRATWNAENTAVEASKLLTVKTSFFEKNFFIFSD